MKRINRNQWLGLFYIGFGLLLLFLTGRIKYMFSISAEDVGPKFFPTCCAVGFMVCGLGKFITSKGKENDPFLNKNGWLRVLIFIGIMIAYILGLTYLGYIVSTASLLCVLPYMLCDADKKPKFIKVLVFSVVMTTITYVAFVYLMKVMLPTGKWTKAILKLLR